MALSDEDAAVRIQGLYRSRKARKMLVVLLQSTFEKVFDEESGEYFYFNSATGESSWVKPKLLKAKGAEPLTPRSREKFIKVCEKKKAGQFKFAKDMSKDEAARMLQGLFRTRKARNQMRQLLISITEKIYDPDTDNYYYYNSKTGETSWFKPTLLGNEDVRADNESESGSPATEMQSKGHENSIQAFLKDTGLNFLQKELENEGFDDMEALLALTSKDAYEIGLKAKHIKSLLEGIKEYKQSNGINLENESVGESDIENDEADESLSNMIVTAKKSMRQIETGSTSKEQESDNVGPDQHDDALVAVDEDEESDEEDSMDEEDYDEDDDEYDDNESVDPSKPIEGVEIEVLFPGDGENFPVKGEYARVHYTASTEDGTVFESSRKRGRVFEFLVGAGHVIRGWDLAIRKMSRGERSRIHIEPEMAYGDVGRKPVVQPGARLVFEVELIDMYVAEVGQLAED